MASISPLLLLIFMFLCSLPTSFTSACSLDFHKFPYETHGECLGLANLEEPAATQPCCQSALKSLFQAISVRANKSRSIFLEPSEAQDCSNTFNHLHNRTSLSVCRFQDSISSSNAPDSCSKDVDSVIKLLGVEKFNALQSSCKDLSTSNYNDDACLECVLSYRESLKALKDSDNRPGREGYCGVALLVSLSSTDADSTNWIPASFSCLWDEMDSESPWAKSTTKREGNLLKSKKLLSALIVAALFVLLAPILYKIARRQLQRSTEIDIHENLSGKTYMATMPSGMKVAIKRFKEGIEISGFVDEICRKAKIRHPNLVSIIGYCDKGDQALVSEYCVCGDLASLLLGESMTPILTWQQRMNIAIGIARGLWYLHSNPMEKIWHGDIKILLNEKLEAKISDFNLSNYNSRVKNRQENISGDVFDFGIVLLQIITGSKSIFVLEERGATRKTGLAMADPRLNGACDSTALQGAMSVVARCTNPNQTQRPTIIVVKIPI